jgi:serine/threonine-protein kinase
VTPERWAQINAAFSAVLDQDPPDQVNYLNKALPDDATLRDEVAGLLRDAQLAESQGFLCPPPWLIDNIPLCLPDFRRGDSEYSQIQYIGHGGMGVVYRAYNNGLDKWVALKLSPPAHLGTARDRHRFREAQNMARLDHPNIVRVLSTGEYEEGRPYFEMDLIERKDGCSLHDHLEEYVERPQRAAELMETVALAVHHAHQRGILHNDLKPGNILLDEEGQPHITDFGLARRLGQDLVASASLCASEEAANRDITSARATIATRSATGAIEGTASYMSPEQADRNEITTLSDVYGLGALFYTLLTGRPPFSGGTVREILQRVRTATSEPPRVLNSKVDDTLEAICLKCLNKEVTQRYTSANELAKDLCNYRTGKETIARSWTRRERIVSWCRRNVVEAGLVAAVVAIWVFALVMAVSVAQARKADLLKANLEVASSTANDLATTALLQLTQLSRNAEMASADPKLAALLTRDELNGLQQILSEVCSQEVEGAGRPIRFKTCYIMNRDGVMRAHFPPAPDLIGKDFSWRDYFQCAKAQNGPVCISRVYRGMSDNLFKFAISAPIRDVQNNFLGIIATAVTTDAAMGPVVLHNPSLKVALIALTERDEQPAVTETNAGKYAILFHPGYQRGVDPVEFPYTNKTNMKPIPSEDNYRDPVSAVAPEYAGRWIAGFAPVGNTRFIVIAQQRFEDAVSLGSSTLWSLALWSALASLVAVGILAMVLWRWARSRAYELPR